MNTVLCWWFLVRISYRKQCYYCSQSEVQIIFSLLTNHAGYWLSLCCCLQYVPFLLPSEGLWQALECCTCWMLFSSNIVLDMLFLCSGLFSSVAVWWHQWHHKSMACLQWMHSFTSFLFCIRAQRCSTCSGQADFFFCSWLFYCFKYNGLTPLEQRALLPSHFKGIWI